MAFRISRIVAKYDFKLIQRDLIWRVEFHHDKAFGQKVSRMSNSLPYGKVFPRYGNLSTKGSLQSPSYKGAFTQQQDLELVKDSSENWSGPDNFCRETVNFSWGHKRLWPKGA